MSTKSKGSTDNKEQSEQAILAAMAQAKASPAARISKANIEAIQKRLGNKKPSEVLGISHTMLAQLATGKQKKGKLSEAQREALKKFTEGLEPNTYYGKKLAGMLWAVEKGA